jgi:hypothetical protein
MLHTSKLDISKAVKTSDIDVFLSDATCAICSTYHTVLKTSPGATIFGQDMLFDIPFIADWQKIGEHRQWLTDLNNARENKGRIDYDYKVAKEKKSLKRPDQAGIEQELRRNWAGIVSFLGLSKPNAMEQNKSLDLLETWESLGTFESFLNNFLRNLRLSSMASGFPRPG